MTTINTGFAQQWTLPQQQGIGAASGYPQYQNSALMPLTLSPMMLQRYYRDALIPQISTMEYEGELRQNGTIRFLREPDPVIMDYRKNGPLKYNTVEMEMVDLTVGQAFQSGYKIDLIDAQMMNMWPTIEKTLINKIPMAMMRKIDHAVLLGLYNEVAPFNRGNAAGRYGSIKLGTYGAPITTDKDNILEVLWRLSNTLDDAGIPAEGRYVVLQPYHLQQIALSDVGLAYASGGAQSMRLTGNVPQPLVNMTVYPSSFLPVMQDSGVRTSYIYAGLKSSLAFATILNNVRILESDPYENTRFVSVIGAYGYGVLYPEALAAAYVTVGS